MAMSPALCSGAGNVTRARCDIQYARSAADVRSIKQCLYRLCRYAGYVLVVLGDDTGAIPSSLLKFSECLTGASHHNSKSAPRGIHCNPIPNEPEYSASLITGVARTVEAFRFAL